MDMLPEMASRMIPAIRQGRPEAGILVDDVDLHDFALFQACFGPGMGLQVGCECANMDFSNDDVDLGDYALWEAGLGGPS